MGGVEGRWEGIRLRGLTPVVTGALRDRPVNGSGYSTSRTGLPRIDADQVVASLTVAFAG